MCCHCTPDSVDNIQSGQALLLAVAKFAATDEQPAPENQNPGGQPEGGGAGDDENPEQGLGF